MKMPSVSTPHAVLAVATCLAVGTGCNTFGDAPDFQASDSGVELDAAHADSGDAGELDAATADAAPADSGTDAGQDADGSRPDMDAEMEPDPRVPVAIIESGCSQTVEHVRLGVNTFIRGDLDPEITLVGRESGVGMRSGILSYSNGGVPHVARFRFGEAGSASSVLEGTATVENELQGVDLSRADLYGGAVGPDDGSRVHANIAVSGDNCASNAAAEQDNTLWWSDTRMSAPASLSTRMCDDLVPPDPHHLIEVVGGYNPFSRLQTNAHLFGMRDGSYSSVRLDAPNYEETAFVDAPSRAEAYAKPTHGSYVLTNSASGSLYVWDVVTDDTPPQPLQDAFADDATPLAAPARPLVDFARLADQRYILAHVRGTDVYIEAYHVVDGRLEHEFVVDIIETGSDRVHGVGLAVYHNGFGVMRIENDPGANMRWIIQPYDVDPDTFQRTGCTRSYTFGDIGIREIDGVGFRAADLLLMFSVQFDFGDVNAAEINVEGGYFPDGL